MPLPPLLSRSRLAVVTAKLCGPGGMRAVAAENLVLKQQLIVLRRDRRRAANLTLSDRLLCGFASLFSAPDASEKSPSPSAPHALGISSGLGARQIPLAVLVNIVPQEAGTDRAGRRTHRDHRRARIGTLGQPETLQEISVPAPARRVPDAEMVECSDRPFGAVAEFG